MSECVAQVLKVLRLTPRQREEYEERAAIKEFDGNMPRTQAEREALEEVQGRQL